MISGQSIKIAILGAGTGGTALIHLFTRSSGVQIIGVADIDSNAPGLKCARSRNIPVTDDPISLISCKSTDLIVDVTGDPTMGSLIADHKAPGVEVLGGTAAKLLWYLVQHEAEIQTQLFQAEKLATIGTFSSGIAHDINNRLYLIMSLAENMLDEKEHPVMLEHASQILSTVRQIRTIVQGLTGYAQVSSNNLEAVELSSTLDEALKMAKYATVFHDVSVIRNYTDCPRVVANSQELLQVFVNLIINAIQAMGGKGTIKLTVKNEDDTATVIISDSGPGIPRDLMDKIFEPFFTTKEPGKGTGLGLYMVQTIVRKYDGRISVDSQEGKGVSLRLQFPRVR